MPRTKRNRDKVEGHKLKIQEIFDTLNAPSAPLPADSRGIATTSKSESGTPLARFHRSRADHSCLFNFAIFQPAGVWLDAHSLRIHSPP